MKLGFTYTKIVKILWEQEQVVILKADKRSHVIIMNKQKTKENACN